MFTALLAHVFDRGISSATVIVLVAVNAAAALVAYIRAQGILRETGERAEPRVYTVRSGKAKRLPGSEIVPGDVIYVSAGDVIPADARIVQSDGITVSETDITGEHGAVRKRSGFPELRGGSISLRAQTNMLFSGSVVMSGSARAVVCRTGRIPSTPCFAPNRRSSAVLPQARENGARSRFSPLSAPCANAAIYGDCA